MLHTCFKTLKSVSSPFFVRVYHPVVFIFRYLHRCHLHRCHRRAAPVAESDAATPRRYAELISPHLRPSRPKPPGKTSLLRAPRERLESTIRVRSGESGGTGDGERCRLRGGALGRGAAGDACRDGGAREGAAGGARGGAKYLGFFVRRVRCFRRTVSSYDPTSSTSTGTAGTQPGRAAPTPTDTHAPSDTTHADPSGQREVVLSAASGRLDVANGSGFNQAAEIKPLAQSVLDGRTWRAQFTGMSAHSPSCGKSWTDGGLGLEAPHWRGFLFSEWAGQRLLMSQKGRGTLLPRNEQNDPACCGAALPRRARAALGVHGLEGQFAYTHFGGIYVLPLVSLNLRGRAGRIQGTSSLSPSLCIISVLPFGHGSLIGGTLLSDFLWEHPLMKTRGVYFGRTDISATRDTREEYDADAPRIDAIAVSVGTKPPRANISSLSLSSPFFVALSRLPSLLMGGRYIFPSAAQSFPVHLVRRGGIRIAAAGYVRIDENIVVQTIEVCVELRSGCCRPFPESVANRA
ncbi:hypothetical protein C8J57DRAFT_1247120 [Mycena rebaudengoi]|nr:hypothetical protein C8J57DRAFT_1247120 [Mycena rebaudengoi]